MEVQRSLKRSAHGRDGLARALFAESQIRKIRMNSASNLLACCRNWAQTVWPKGHSQLKAQRLLRKGKRASVPDHTSVASTHKPCNIARERGHSVGSAATQGLFDLIIITSTPAECMRLCLRMVSDPVEAEDLFRRYYTVAPQDSYLRRRIGLLHLAAPLAVTSCFMRLRRSLRGLDRSDYRFGR